MKRVFVTKAYDHPGPQRLKIGEGQITLMRQNFRTPDQIDIWYESDAARAETEFEMIFEVVPTNTPVGYENELMGTVVMDEKYVRHIYRRPAQEMKK